MGEEREELRLLQSAAQLVLRQGTRRPQHSYPWRGQSGQAARDSHSHLADTSLEINSP